MDSININQIEKLIKGKYLLKIEEHYNPRFEEKEWRKTNGYVKYVS